MSALFAVAETRLRDPDEYAFGHGNRASSSGGGCWAEKCVSRFLVPIDFWLMKKFCGRLLWGVEGFVATERNQALRTTQSSKSDSARSR